MYFHCGATWFLIVDWWDTSITVHLHNVLQLLKLVTPFQIQRPVVTIRANSSQAATLGISSSQMWQGLFQPQYLWFTLCFNTAFVAASALNLAWGIRGIGGMGRFSYMVKILILMVVIVQVHPPSAFFFPTELYLEIIKEKQQLNITSFWYGQSSIGKPSCLIGPFIVYIPTATALHIKLLSEYTNTLYK